MTYPRPVPDDPSAPDQVAASPRFPDVEKGILAFWKRDDTFRASVEQREGCDEWVFYDGPPFANGLPHYGHLLTGYAKDAFPRFQTMRGKQVHRRFGWDTHGLPAELEAMRQLGITEKSEIEEMGVEEFNAVARRSVLEYTGEWEDYVTRSARWVDFEDDYKTLDVDFMESVIWAFKQLHDKGLAYEGFRVLPYCWHDQTPLSNHELRMDDDVYRMRQDQSVTVTFPLVGAKAESLGLTAVRALAWTTTPWTLPTNMALAVGPDIVYAVVPAGPAGTPDAEAPDSLPRASSVQLAAEVLGSEYLIAQDLVGNYAKDLGYASADEARAAVSRTVLGRQLEGVAYDRLWDFYADSERFGTENAWQVLVADYVTTTDGTGIVHQAPAYGEEDQQVCAAAGIPVILSLDEGGRFVDTVPEVAGELWSDAGRTLTRMLKAQGRLIRQASYEHSYPHCWRCKNPLIYKAVSSWFVRVTDFRDDMVRLNQDIAWTPENVKDGQFGKGSATRATGRSAATASGAARSRYGRATTRPTRASTSTAASTSSRPTSACARRTCTARSSTSSRARTRTTPRGRAPCVASRTCSTSGSTPDPCPSPRCTTRSRTASGSTSTARRTSSSSTSARPAAGSTRCTRCRPRCSGGRRSRAS